MKTGLVLEGGAFRTIFSCGVCDAFLDAGLPLPDYTVGVSAGIAYGVSYLSRQSRRNLKLLTTYANDKRYMGVGNFLDRRNRSYFGLKFSYETIPNELLPFDYETFAAYPGTVEAVVTNLNTGRAEYLEVPRKDEHFLLLQATCAIPLMFPVIHLDGPPYLDGSGAASSGGGIFSYRTEHTWTRTVDGETESVTVSAEARVEEVPRLAALTVRQYGSDGLPLGSTDIPLDGTDRRTAWLDGAAWALVEEVSVTGGVTRAVYDRPGPGEDPVTHPFVVLDERGLGTPLTLTLVE